jgi:hypothetical protein
LKILVRLSINSCERDNADVSRADDADLLEGTRSIWKMRRRFWLNSSS